MKINLYIKLILDASIDLQNINLFNIILESWKNTSYYFLGNALNIDELINKTGVDLNLF